MASTLGSMNFSKAINEIDLTEFPRVNLVLLRRNQMKNHTFIKLLILGFCFFFIVSNSQAAVITIDGWKAEYWRNHPIGTVNYNYDRAVVVIHGSDRNADDYYYRIRNAVETEDMFENTLIVAPRFPEPSDPVADDMLYWDGGDGEQQGWRGGQDSVNGPGVSSFSVIDVILQEINDNFPNIKVVTVVGHSAGGQVVQRYAAINVKEDDLRDDLKVKYVVANPSTYMYLWDDRPDLLYAFEDDPMQNCDSIVTYNTYYYGLAGLPWSLPYAFWSYEDLYPLETVALIRDQLTLREVYVMLGTADTQTGGGLVNSCEAKAQGPNRYERGLNYFDHIINHYPDTNHELVEIANVGHNSNAMFNSRKGRELLLYANSDNDWENLGGVIEEQPECVSWGTNRIDCFARGGKNNLYHRWWDGSDWHGWQNLGGETRSQPSCLSRMSNTIDCFVRGAGNRMHHISWNGSYWETWQDLGGVIKDQPECVSWGLNRIDCFARGGSDRMYHKYWDGSNWHGWNNLGGVIKEQPDCVSWGYNRIDCFARGGNNRMYHKYWDGSSWHGWDNLGGVLKDRPECVSWGFNRIDCFVRGGYHAMYHKYWDGFSWHGWQNLGGAIKGQPECVSWGPNRIDCFARGGEDRMYHRWWNGSSWGGWEDLGGLVKGKPDCVSWEPHRLDCFARGNGDRMYHTFWNDIQWNP
ncbi:MAG: hypothetical protein V2J55_17140 [Candidatus Competibacteraceae bacterium]|jgi:hypothetical protein|nr:hypothetical protein [Candidatus Competibacteraceae bacterium]